MLAYYVFSKLQLFWVVEAFKDVLNNRELRVSQTDMEEVNARVYAQIEQEQQEQRRENATRSRKWLEETSKQEGVQTTEDGFLYRIVEQGNDEHATDDDYVFFYGILEDGQGEVIESIHQKGDPAFGKVGDLAQEFAYGIKLIGKGGKIEMWIGFKLGYDEYEIGDIYGRQALHAESELSESVNEVEEDEKRDTKSIYKSKKNKKKPFIRVKKVSL